MTRRPRTSSTLTVIALVAAAALSLSGCTSSAPASDGGGSAPAMVPKNLVEDGKLTFSITAIGAPLSSFDADDKAVGLIPDLLSAAAATMGLESNPQRVQSDGAIPGLDAARFDLHPEAADLPTRRADYILVDYFKSGAALLVASGNPLGIKDKTGLCGLRVAVAKSSLQESMANDQSAACVAAGKDAIEITAIADSSLQLPITSGRADASWISLPSAQYLAASQPDQFGVTGSEFLVDLAMMFRADDAELAGAVKAALDELKKTGLYDEILSHYSQQDSALTEFTSNLPS
jgi:polar amino acid transport system substrate-binding protein